MGRGRAATSAAVSIVNALATGLGAALSIDLHLEAYVEIKSGRGLYVEFEGFQPRDTKLVEACISKVTRYAGLTSGYEANVRIRSDIPIAKGLKSSSAASNAIVLAAIEALGISFDSLRDKLKTALNIAVDASLEAGVTITGAFDDASASMLGGMVVTDNFSRDIIYRSRPGEDLRVVLYIPKEERYTSDVDVGILKRLEGFFRLAWRLAVAGYWMEAMNINGLAVASALGYDVNPLLDALEAGALAASPSGKGPALAAIVREDRVDGVVDRWSKLEGEVKVVGTNNSYAYSRRED
ncbi:MAG: shikimate kinase [Candidatus Bathyarchaeota archaeon]|nr:shikimate kinase [Candidatus Bathyarchaeota archaeon]